MKKAVPVRMPDWDEGDFPRSKQLELYLLYWERRRDPLAPDPGVGACQRSFWLDPDDLDVDAYEAGCFRASRPDRAMLIRRLIATYHKPRTSRPMTDPKPTVTRPAPQITSTSPIATARQILEHASAQTAFRERELSPAQVNEILDCRASGSVGSLETYIGSLALQARNPVYRNSTWTVGNWQGTVLGETKQT